MTIVMCNEDGQDSPEMLFVQEQQPVETLGPNSAYEALRHDVRLRGAKRRPNHLAPGAAKHLVERVGELLVPIADDVAERF
jgi:hypothetical protein